jgi:hypothetical protein
MALAIVSALTTSSFISSFRPDHRDFASRQLLRWKTHFWIQNMILEWIRKRWNRIQDSDDPRSWHRGGRIGQEKAICTISDGEFLNPLNWEIFASWKIPAIPVRGTSDTEGNRRTMVLENHLNRLMSLASRGRQIQRICSGVRIADLSDGSWRGFPTQSNRLMKLSCNRDTPVESSWFSLIEMNLLTIKANNVSSRDLDHLPPSPIHEM